MPEAPVCEVADPSAEQREIERRRTEAAPKKQPLTLKRVNELRDEE